MSKTTPLGLISRDSFEVIDFVDHYESECSVEQSSLCVFLEFADYPGASAIWLGDNLNRMCLDRDQVKALLAVLETWLETGSFDAEHEKLPHGIRSGPINRFSVKDQNAPEGKR